MFNFLDIKSNVLQRSSMPTILFMQPLDLESILASQHGVVVEFIPFRGRC